MTGTATPRSASLRSISGTAAAAASVLTVTRTSWLPAWARRATWIAVASGSAVSVFVIDWTTTGWALPTSTPPTSTETVDRRRGRSVSEPGINAPRGRPSAAAETARDADEVGQPLRPEREPLADEALQDQHQHPTAVEGRERQDVHDGEVGREDAGQVEGHDRAEAPEDVADLGRDADRAGGRRRLRWPGHDRGDELADAVDDQAHRGRGALDADSERVLDRVGHLVADHPSLEREARLLADAERALALGDLVRRAQGRRQLDRLVPSSDRQGDRLAGAV